MTKRRAKRQRILFNKIWRKRRDLRGRVDGKPVLRFDKELGASLFKAWFALGA